MQEIDPTGRFAEDETAPNGSEKRRTSPSRRRPTLLRAAIVLSLVLGALTGRLVIADDSNGDGIDDTVDNCPSDYNPLQEDRDTDGLGDLCDNCRGIDSPGQTDVDGFGDLCDRCVLGEIEPGGPCSLILDVPTLLDLTVGGVTTCPVTIGSYVSGVVSGNACFPDGIGRSPGAPRSSSGGRPGAQAAIIY